MKKLTQLIKLSSKITIYVPAAFDVDAAIDNSRQVEETAQFLAECFGGATSTPAVGWWLSELSGLVREKTTMVFAYAKEKDLEANIEKVVELCEELCRTMR